MEILLKSGIVWSISYTHLTGPGVHLMIWIFHRWYFNVRCELDIANVYLSAAEKKAHWIQNVQCGVNEKIVSPLHKIEIHSKVTWKVNSCYVYILKLHLCMYIVHTVQHAVDLPKLDIF